MHVEAKKYSDELSDHLTNQSTEGDECRNRFNLETPWLCWNWTGKWWARHIGWYDAEAGNRDLIISKQHTFRLHDIKTVHGSCWCILDCKILFTHWGLQKVWLQFIINAWSIYIHSRNRGKRLVELLKGLLYTAVRLGTFVNTSEVLIHIERLQW